jgi:hypothetical protein
LVEMVSSLDGLQVVALSSLSGDVSGG